MFTVEFCGADAYCRPDEGHMGEGWGVTSKRQEYC